MGPETDRSVAPPRARRPEGGAPGAAPLVPGRVRRAAALALLCAAPLSCGGAVEAEGAAPLPDVLIAFVDGLGVADVAALGAHLGLRASAQARTPAFDTLAREGVSYTDVYAPSPWSSESLDSALSSLLPPEPGGSPSAAAADAVAPDAAAPERRPWRPGLAEHLEREGYRTALVVGDARLAPAAAPPGFDDLVLVPGLDADGGATADAVADAALAWMAGHSGPELVVCVLADPAPPHHAYPDFAPEGALDGPPGRVPAGLSHGELLRRAPEFDAADRARLAALHASEVGAADDAFARIAGAMVARRDEAPVLVVAGLRPPALGADGGPVGLVPSLRPDALRVPLLVRFPEAYLDRERPVGVAGVHGSLVDLGPTLLDALGFTPRGDVDGRSLFPGARHASARVVVARTWRGIAGEALIGRSRAEVAISGPGEARRATYGRAAGGDAAEWRELDPAPGGGR